MIGAGSPPGRAHKVFAVVVAYGPDPKGFAKVLNATQTQVSAIVVADNGRGAGLGDVAWSDSLERLDMTGNAGIAAAQNAGIRRALSRGATHVLLLDHDSVLCAGATDVLLAAWDEQTRRGRRVAAIGANYRDPRRPDISPFVRILGWRCRRVAETSPGEVVDVSYLVSSGSLISRDAFDAVGPMNELLFIDYVDIEWGLRAGQKDWQCFGAFGAALEHKLGDTPLKILGRSYPLHSPLRHYYMTRNAVWLVSRARLPIGSKFAEGWRLLKRSLVYATFAPQPRLHIVSMIAGLWDGLRGRLGPRESARWVGVRQIPFNR